MLKFHHTILQLNLPALCALWQESRDTENISYDNTDRDERNNRIFHTFVCDLVLNYKSSPRFICSILLIFYIPARCILSAINSGCGKSGSKCGRVVYSSRALMFGMLALLRDGFFCCKTVSTLSNKKETDIINKKKAGVACADLHLRVLPIVDT